MCAVSVGTAGQYRPQSRLHCASSTERDQKEAFDCDGQNVYAHTNVSFENRCCCGSAADRVYLSRWNGHGGERQPRRRLCIDKQSSR
jgi:hypothetical protein